MEEEELARELTELRPHSAPADGPLVSIVVANRNGQEDLRRLLDGLSNCTRYRPIEVVLVDNASTDGSLLLLDHWVGKKKFVSNDRTQTISVASNQGIRAAEGELILLANNAIEPIHPDWLGFMVESLEEKVAAVGAMLIHPERPKRKHPPAYPDLTINHLGVRFEYSEWGVGATNVGLGEDPRSIAAPDRREVPAVSGACLLARRSDLLINAFDEHYKDGAEDWDLCLRLGNFGKIVIDERAVLFHHEYSTSNEHVSEARQARRNRNNHWFNDLWGPALMRELRAEATGAADGQFFRGDPALTVCVTRGSSDETCRVAEQLRQQAREAGWEVVDDESERSDITIATAPPHDVQGFARRDLSLALVVDRVNEWVRTGSLDAAKRIVVPSHVGQARLEALWGSGIAEIDEGLDAPDPELFTRLVRMASPRPKSMRIGVSTCAPDWTKAQFWGDTHLARGLMRAFRRLGQETSELIVDDWRGTSASSCDVIIHLRGSQRRPVARGQWNLLWIISHPDKLEPGECDGYDLVASASQRHAEQLSAELGRPVHFLPQATDADTFKIGLRDVDYEASVLYVGNARWPPRRAPRWLMRNNRPFHMYGKNWDSFPEAELVTGEYIPNQDLAAAYRSAEVVVADHHGSMRTNGFVANRICDVLASGGLVLSDDVKGLSEMFGDLVPTYSDARELESQLDFLLSDAAHRRRLAAEGRQVVMSQHTLDHRARSWLEMLEEL